MMLVLDVRPNTNVLTERDSKIWPLVMCSLRQGNMSYFSVALIKLHDHRQLMKEFMFQKKKEFIVAEEHGIKQQTWPAQ